MNNAAKKLSIFLVLQVMLCSCGDSQQTATDNNSARDKENAKDLIKLQAYLKEHQLELCSFNKELEDVAAKVRKEATAKYGDIPTGQDSTLLKEEYNTRRQLDEVKEVCKNHGVKDSVAQLVYIFAMDNCK